MVTTKQWDSAHRRSAIRSRSDHKRTSATSTGTAYAKVTMVLVHYASLATPSSAPVRRRQSSNAQLVLLALGLVTVCMCALKMAHMIHSVESNPDSQRSMTAVTQSVARDVNTSLSPLTLWKADYNVVHVIQTRFMQNQPKLLALGLARLKLFQALTIPSVQHQTVQNFLWIVRTDPSLHSSLKRQLKAALSNVSNAVLVASNANPEGFRHESCVADITADTILSGSLALVQSFHQAAADHVVLETRCDADDAVATDFVEMVQSSALDMLQQDWMVWCAENHLEWQYDSPWANTTQTGALLAVKAGKCITPGLTWGYTVNASRANIPVSKHHQIQKVVPACGSDAVSKCLIKLGGDMPLALRARTPTSAGMDHILITSQTEHSFPMEQLQKSKWRTTQDTLWESLPALFGVDGSSLWAARTWIHDNFRAIVRDALAGQCTRGHSCKEDSRKVLQRLLNTGHATS